MVAVSHVSFLSPVVLYTTSADNYVLVAIGFLFLALFIEVRR